jgi:SNF2 family DNA or RNA helicase
MGRTKTPPTCHCPANLRKQWSMEMAEKFHLPSVILEARNFNAAVKTGNVNPFDQKAIVLCSYQFVRSKEGYVRSTEWDLVVIDEAHRLRNVYKASSKIAQTIKAAVASRPKVLLTATPLQNSLMELYGLVSIIDDYAFGDAKSFSARFVRPRNNPEALAELKSRLDPICTRTLRRYLLEYINYPWCDRVSGFVTFQWVISLVALYLSSCIHIISAALPLLPVKSRVSAISSVFSS